MANRQGVADCGMENVLVTKKFKLASLEVTLAADNYPITVEHPPVIYIDPAAAARDVLLPAIDGNSKGLTFVIFNTSDNATGAEDITLKTSADAALVPAVVISKSEGAVVTNNGTGWKAIVGANT